MKKYLIPLLGLLLVAGIGFARRDGFVPTPYGGPDWANVAITGGTITGVAITGLTSADIEMAIIAGATYTTVQDMQNVFHSAGWVSGGGITDDADGTITVAAGTGLIRATDTAVAEIVFTDWAAEAGANVALADNDISWVYVEYNAGSPQVVAVTTERTDYNTNILLGSIQRTGTTLHINVVDKHVVGDHANSMIRRLKDTMAFAQVSGGIISATGTRNIALTTGSFWQGLTEFSTAAFDSSGADRFSYWYRLVSDSGWVEVATQSAIHQTNYDDNSGTLATLSNNKYGVHWVYLEVDDDVNVVYGQGDYTLAQAEDAQAPAAVPEQILTHGFLVGKIIIKKSAAAFAQIESAFTSTFAGSLATDHGSLAGLADDDHTQYLLADGSRALAGAWDMGSQNLTNVDIDSGTINGVASPSFTGTVAADIVAATGTINGLVKVTLTTAATLVLTAANTAGDFHVNGDNDVIDYTLPGAAAGLTACFYAGSFAQVVTIDPVDGTDTIYLDGASVGAGDAIDSAGGVADYVCLIALDATNWHTLGRSGTWVDGGVD